MTKKEWILKAITYNPREQISYLEEKAEELASKWYLTLPRTNLPSKSTWLTPAQIAKSYFKEWIDWPIHKRLIEINWNIIEELKKFDNYWTELNKSWTKQRWEQQKTFEVQRRLATWLWNKKTSWSNNFQKQITTI